MTHIANPLTYEKLKADIGTNYFKSGPGYSTHWILDRNSPDLLLIRHERFEVLRVKPDGYVRMGLGHNEFGEEWNWNTKAVHFGISGTKLVKTANKDAFFLIYDMNSTRQEIITGPTYIEGVYRPDQEASVMNLGLDYFIPPQFLPQERAKVPRKVIAQLREHVTEQFKQAKVQAKLLGGTSKWEIGRLHDDKDPILHKVWKAFGAGNLTARGELMVTNDLRFWRHAIAHYANPASLIDSCRSDFYDAANVRAVEKPKEIEPPKFQMVDVSISSS